MSLMSYYFSCYHLSIFVVPGSNNVNQKLYFSKKVLQNWNSVSIYMGLSTSVKFLEFRCLGYEILKKIQKYLLKVILAILSYR